MSKGLTFKREGETGKYSYVAKAESGLTYRITQGQTLSLTWIGSNLKSRTYWLLQVIDKNGDLLFEDERDTRREVVTLAQFRNATSRKG